MTLETPHLGEALPPLIAAVAYLALYTRRGRTLARQGRPVPRSRVISFWAGVVVVVAVQVGPLDTLADEILAAHMLQHVVLGDIASLMLVYGLTGPVLAPLLHLRATRPLRALVRPVPALCLWAVSLYAWHLPFAYQLAVRVDLVHAAEHACFLWLGMLLWLAIFGPLPKPAWFERWGALGYVTAVRFLGLALANVFIWDQSLLYPLYRARDAAHGIGPLLDQGLAGGVMMIEQMFLTAILLGWLFLRFFRRDEQRQRLLDLATERGVALTPERAGIAVRAGTGDRLGRRLLGAPPITALADLPSGLADEPAVVENTLDAPCDRALPGGAPPGS